MISKTTRYHDQKKLLGRKICIDFVNTVDWRGRDKPEEQLDTYDDLVVWASSVGILTDEEKKNLKHLAKIHSVKAKKELISAKALREIIYSIFSALEKGKPASSTDLSDFNVYFSNVMCNSKIVFAEDGFSWQVDNKTNPWEWIINPIVWSVAELLVSAEVHRVRRCADNECRWLFMDSSRNQSRRWCDMKDCGNRAKARRYYQRQKNKSR